MEKTTTQRIIGILVVIALVIILLPLLFDKNEATAKVAVAKAPPFPEQPVPANETTTVTADSKKAPDFVEIPPEMADQINQNANTTPTVDNKLVEVKEAIAPSEPSTNGVVTTPPVETAKPVAMNSTPSKIAETQPLPEPKSTSGNVEKPVIEKIIKAVDVHSDQQSKHAKKVMKFVSHESSKPSVTKLNKTAWAIQLGSFKNKDNARRLADKLRAAGYKAFMHEIKSSKSVQTRVYIGPEYQQASAEKLSSQLEEHMNLHGLVIPYKPLDL